MRFAVILTCVHGVACVTARATDPGELAARELRCEVAWTRYSGALADSESNEYERACDVLSAQTLRARCDRGESGRACFLVAIRLAERDSPEAREALARACELGHWPACLKLQYAGTPAAPRAFARLESACDRQQRAACEALGQWRVPCDGGKGGGDPCAATAAAALGQACQLGSAPSCRELAKLLLSNRIQPWPMALERAREIFQTACARGLGPACEVSARELRAAWLERRCRSGRPGDPPGVAACLELAHISDDATAARWLELLCMGARALPASEAAVPAACREDPRRDPVLLFARACAAGQQASCGFEDLARRRLAEAMRTCMQARKGCARAGEYLWRGVGVARDIPGAAAQLRRGCHKDQPDEGACMTFLRLHADPAAELEAGARAPTNDALQSRPAGVSTLAQALAMLDEQGLPAISRDGRRIAVVESESELDGSEAARLLIRKSAGGTLRPLELFVGLPGEPPPDELERNERRNQRLRQRAARVLFEGGYRSMLPVASEPTDLTEPAALVLTVDDADGTSDNAQLLIRDIGPGKIRMHKTVPRIVPVAGEGDECGMAHLTRVAAFFDPVTRRTLIHMMYVSAADWCPDETESISLLLP